MITNILHECHVLYPELVIVPELEVTNIPLLIAWLRTGRIDACLLPLPIDDDDELTIEPLVDEDCVIALPRGHALANSESAALASLAKETFVLVQPGAAAPGCTIPYSLPAHVRASAQSSARRRPRP